MKRVLATLMGLTAMLAVLVLSNTALAHSLTRPAFNCLNSETPRSENPTFIDANGEEFYRNGTVEQCLAESLFSLSIHAILIDYEKPEGYDRVRFFSVCLEAWQRAHLSGLSSSVASTAAQCLSRAIQHTEIASELNLIAEGMANANMRDFSWQRLREMQQEWGDTAWAARKVSICALQKRSC